MTETPAKDDLRAHVRAETIEAEDTVVLRGGPDTAQKLLEHARRLHAVYVLDRQPVFGVSVAAALDELGPSSLDAILGQRLTSYRLVHMPRAGDLVAAGFQLLPTFQRPHYTLVLESDEDDVIERLASALGPPRPNPYHWRSTKPRR